MTDNKDIEQQPVKNDEIFEGGGENLMGKVNVDEDPTKCCFFIPIEIGVIIMGISIILSAVQLVLGVLQYLSYDFIFAVVLGVLGVPLCIAAFYFAMYFKDRENKDGRANLPKGCVYACITGLAQALWYVVWWLIQGYGLGNIVSQIVSAVITFLIYAYCRGVC